MTRALIWSVDGCDWPLRPASRFVPAGGLRWHVQVLGSGPPVLLIHGSGAASHTWRGLAPRLAETHTVIAPDLPGHGFSSVPAGGLRTIAGFAAALQALLERLKPETDPVPIGHSSGAAVAARLILDGRLTQDRLIGLSPAMVRLPGWQGRVFGPTARLLSSGPVLPRLLALQARAPGSVERLLASTGSSIDAEGVALYRRLLGNAGHIGNVLKTMAQWDLDRLDADLDRLRCKVRLIHGAADPLIRLADVQRLASRLPDGRCVSLPGLGHLAHEEAPERVAAVLEQVLDGD